MNEQTILEALTVDSIMIGCLFISVGLLAIFEVNEYKLYKLNLQLWVCLMLLTGLIDLGVLSAWLGAGNIIDALVDPRPNTMAIRREVVVGMVLSLGALVSVLRNTGILPFYLAKYGCAVGFIIGGLLDYKYHFRYDGFNETINFSNYYLLYFTATLIVIGIIQLYERYRKIAPLSKVLWSIILISHGTLNIISKPAHLKKYIFSQQESSISLGQFTYELFLSYIITFLLLAVFILIYRNLHQTTLMNKLREMLGCKTKIKS